MDFKHVTQAAFMIAVAAIIAFLYSRFILLENDSTSTKHAVRGSILVALSYAIVYYFTDGSRDAVLAEPFYAH